MAKASMFLLCFFFTTLLYTSTAQQRPYRSITTGSSLTPTGNSSWSSPSGLYSFGFYNQGHGYYVGIFISGIPQRTVVWTSRRDYPPVNQTATLALTTGGRLILQPTQGQEIDIPTKPQSQLASSASMLDTGNFVLYNSDQDIIWQSFDHPTDTLLVGQPLLNGAALVSSVSLTDHSSGISYLYMQPDGNLVQFPREGPWIERNAYYAAGTNTAGNNVTLNLDDDGSLYLFNTTTVIRNLSQGGHPKERRIYLVRNDPDGIFGVYSYDLDQQNSNWSRLWRPNGDNCVAKGICGWNGYCVLEDTEAKCVCIPGFDFIDWKKWTAGCIRNTTVRSCRNNDGSIKYNMMELANTIWEEYSYSTLSDTTKEDCKSACIKDCNCEAALFEDGQCRMHKLPLKYGRRLVSASNVALVKMESESAVNQNPPGTRSGMLSRVLIGAIGAAIAFLIIVGFLGRKLSMKWRKKTNLYHNIELTNHAYLTHKRFSYPDIKKMTNSFKDKLGEGANGIVYKGKLKNGNLVAVKVLKESKGEGEEFFNEVASISRTSHVNVVTLVGFCFNGKKRALIYEFMPNGSLDKFVYGGVSSTNHQLGWDKYYEIAIGIARGLEYLHRGCNTRILHFDIKPHNILLDEDFVPKISDFGLAKLCHGKESAVSMTNARGTIGYIAPEVFYRRRVSPKSDVFSYGMMVLQLVGGRKNIKVEVDNTSEIYFSDWIYEKLELDKELGLYGIMNEDENVYARKMIIVSLWCIQSNPSTRPSMSRVVEMLEGSLESIEIPPKPILSSPPSAPTTHYSSTTDLT